MPTLEELEAQLKALPKDAPERKALRRKIRKARGTKEPVAPEPPDPDDPNPPSGESKKERKARVKAAIRHATEDSLRSFKAELDLDLEKAGLTAGDSKKAIFHAFSLILSFEQEVTLADMMTKFQARWGHPPTEFSWMPQGTEILLGLGPLSSEEAAHVEGTPDLKA